MLITDDGFPVNVLPYQTECPECSRTVPRGARFCPGCSFNVNNLLLDMRDQLKEKTEARHVGDLFPFNHEYQLLKYTVLGILIVFALLWIVGVTIGGEQETLASGQLVFHGKEMEKGDEIRIRMWTDDGPVDVYFNKKTDFDRSSDERVFFHKEAHHKVDAGTLRTLVFSVPSDNTWGFTMVNNNPVVSTTYRFQILRPFILGHFRYSIIPIVLVVIGSFVVLFYIYIREVSKREFLNRMFQYSGRYDHKGSVDDDLEEISESTPQVKDEILGEGTTTRSDGEITGNILEVEEDPFLPYRER